MFTCKPFSNQGTTARIILIVLACGAVFWACSTGDSNSSASLIADHAQVTQLANGFKFTEGPTPDGSGNIYFSDIPNNRIHIWSVEDSSLSTFIENSEGANGLMFDDNGNLLACQGSGRQLGAIDPQGDVTVLADQYKGKKLNSPNDLWLDPHGGIYFTDPRYGSRDDMQMDGEHVYYLSPDRNTLIRVIDDLVRPNGLIGTPDGSILYVADHKDDKTHKYSINPDGTLTDKTLFAEEGSDGVALDEQGNLYLTGAAVRIYSPKGEFLQQIDIPERPTNVCFGGTKGNTLFITAQTSLYAIDMTVGAAQ